MLTPVMDFNEIISILSITYILYFSYIHDQFYNIYDWIKQFI